MQNICLNNNQISSMCNILQTHSYSIHKFDTHAFSCQIFPLKYDVNDTVKQKFLKAIFLLSLFHLTAHFAVLSRSHAIFFPSFIHIGKSTKLVWRADANPLASGYYHIDGKVPKWLEKAHLHVDGQTSQQVSAAVRAEQKSLETYKRSLWQRQIAVFRRDFVKVRGLICPKIILSTSL